MRPGVYALVAGAAFLAMALSAIVAGTALFSGARLDLTQDQRFSISAGSRDVVARLEEPVTLTLYLSRSVEAASPALRARVAQVRALLAGLRRAGGPRVRVNERDPGRNEDAARTADAIGIEAFRPGPDQPGAYFGLEIVNALDERRVIARLDQASDAGLEYDVASAISALSFNARPRLALITALPIDLDRAREADGGGDQPSLIADLLQRADIEPMARDFTAIPNDVDGVVVLHPWPLTQQQLYAIDQAILRSGRAFVALDPAFLGVEDMPFDPLAAPVLSASSLAPILSAWGLAMPDSVTLDQVYALPIEVVSPQGLPVRVPQPLYFSVRPEGFARDDAATRGLTQGVNVGAAGHFVQTPQAGVTITPLLQTSPRIGFIGAQEAMLRPSPQRTLNTPVQAGPAMIAARVRGRLASAFGAQRPAGVLGDESAPHIAQASRDVSAVVFADVDALEDRYYIGPPPERRREADNGAFVLNAIEGLAGSDALLALRARRDTPRRLTVLDDVRASARAEAASASAALDQALRAAQSELATLGGADRDDPRVRTAMQRLNTEIADIRASLRRAERDERAALDRATSALAIVITIAMPMLVLVAGLLVAWRRRRPRESAPT